MSNLVLPYWGKGFDAMLHLAQLVTPPPPPLDSGEFLGASYPPFSLPRRSSGLVFG